MAWPLVQRRFSAHTSKQYPHNVTINIANPQPPATCNTHTPSPATPHAVTPLLAALATPTDAPGKCGDAGTKNVAMLLPHAGWHLLTGNAASGSAIKVTHATRPRHTLQGGSPAVSSPSYGSPSPSAHALPACRQCEMPPRRQRFPWAHRGFLNTTLTERITLALRRDLAPLGCGTWQPRPLPHTLAAHVRQSSPHQKGELRCHHSSHSCWTYG